MIGTRWRVTFVGIAWRALVLLALPGVADLDGQVALSAPPPGKVSQVKPALFSTPDKAMQAIVEAAKAKDREALVNVFGPEADRLFFGDRAQNSIDLEGLAAGLAEAAHLRKDGDSSYTLMVGKDQWPFPIPIVSQEGQWRFDTAAGIEELLNRRIGDNELSAVTTCRAYAVAQWEYFTDGDLDKDGVAEYAQKFVSSPGKHDGLYWETSEGEKTSPMGKLVAAARAGGAGDPYHGYYFKILTRQGPHAPGGKYNYIINGNMIAGYALVAYPAQWGDSGVMTFIVNQQGRVYQRNLGLKTEQIARDMTVYDPNPSWRLVDP